MKEGYFADIAIFDPATIADRATFEKPHQYAVGMKHVLVNGQIVLKDGEHTGAMPGRALKGPGARAQRPGDALWNALASMQGLRGPDGRRYKPGDRRDEDPISRGRIALDLKERAHGS